MPVMLRRWNDDKLDALDSKVDGLGIQMGERFRQVEGRFERVDVELREQRSEIREQRKEAKAGFEAVHRTLIHTTVAVLTAFVAGFAALIGLIATQL